jgi:hypothetical protein
MGVALKLSYYSLPSDHCRWRRCWISILSLHTYQALLFRDVDLKSLLDTLPAQSTLSGTSLGAEGASTTTAGTLVMDIKIRLLNIVSRICHKEGPISSSSGDTLESLDAEITREREIWTAKYLVNGSPSVVDATSYTYWCIFEVYANQLYLHLHRPFCRLRSSADKSQYRPFSRWRCITSGSAMLEFNQKFLEFPRFRHYRWTMFGFNATCTVHGALALASCLLGGDDETLDLAPYRLVFDAAVNRIGQHQLHSLIYKQAYPILRHIQYVAVPVGVLKNMLHPH